MRVLPSQSINTIVNLLEMEIFSPVLELSTGEGNGTPLQYSCLENPMDGEVW